MAKKRETDNWKTNNDNYFRLNERKFNFAQNISNKNDCKNKKYKIRLNIIHLK